MTADRDWDGSQKRPGWAKGKRVWFKDDAPGMVAASSVGHASGTIVTEDTRMTLNGIEMLLDFGGEQRWVVRDRLRLTEPKPRAERVATAHERPEAIDPKYGVEQTIFDVLHDG